MSDLLFDAKTRICYECDGKEFADRVCLTCNTIEARINNPGDLPWKCFQCEEIFYNEVDAADHFGRSEYESPVPGCVRMLTDGEKAILRENARFREDEARATSKAENLEHDLFTYKWNIGVILGHGKTIDDLKHEWEFLQGRVKAAEERATKLDHTLRNIADLIGERPKWSLPGRAPSVFGSIKSLIHQVTHNYFDTRFSRND